MTFRGVGMVFCSNYTLYSALKDPQIILALVIYSLSCTKPQILTPLSYDNHPIIAFLRDYPMGILVWTMVKVLAILDWNEVNRVQFLGIVVWNRWYVRFLPLVTTSYFYHNRVWGLNSGLYVLTHNWEGFPQCIDEPRVKLPPHKPSNFSSQFEWWQKPLRKWA